MPDDFEFGLNDLPEEGTPSAENKAQSLNAFAGETMLNHPALSPTKKEKRVNFPFRMLESEREALSAVAKHLGKSANQLCWDMVIPAILNKKKEIDSKL